MSGGLAGRTYRAALALLPPAIRRKHGEGMHALFLDQVERAAARGRRARAAAVAAGLWDLLVRAAYERRRLRRASPGESRVRRVAHDLGAAARTLRRAPRFSLLVLVTLALGIGANSALFSVVHGVILRPLPFPDAERVTHLAWERGGGLLGHVPHYKVAFWRERSRAFEDVTTWWAVTAPVGPEGSETPVGGLRVAPGFLEVVGWRPALGRTLTADDGRPGAPDVAVIGHRLWRDRFGASRAALGSTLRIGGTPHTVVGVLSADYAFPQAEDRDGFLVPLRARPDPADEGENYPLLARLRPGVDREAAAADLARVGAAFRAEHPGLINASDGGMRLATYQDLYVSGVEATLWILMGATALVLLIACANVAALYLARSTARRNELAVRTALGAGRARLAGQVLAESLILSLAAAALGLGVARLGTDVLLGLYPGTLPRGQGVGLSGVVLAYTVGAALLTGLVFGLVAAGPALRGAVSATLRGGDRGATRGGRLRQGLLVAESAVSLVLLVAAGLLIATLAEIRSVDPGFDARGLVVASLPPVDGEPGSPEGAAATHRIVDALEAEPAVRSAATASSYPLVRGLNFPVGVLGRPDAYEGAVELRSVSPGYLETMGIELVRGRALTDADAGGAPPVALVNEAFAARFFPDGPAVGRRIEIGRYRDRYVAPGLDVGGTEIVGVVADVRERSLRTEGRTMVLLPERQTPAVIARPPTLLARAPGRAGVAAVRRVLAAASPGAAPPEIRRMEDVLADSLAAERFNALLMLVFAGVALLLTAFGVYGIVSYGTRQRTREIGIRVALGAHRRSVTALVVRQGMAPVAAGLVLGVLAALALTRLMTRLLWGVSPTDPATIASVAAVLAGVALVASWLPAREATGLDPRESLRPE